MNCKYESQEVSLSNIHVILKCFLKQGNWNYGSTVFSYFYLNLGKWESDKNDDSDFEIMLHFEAAVVAEQY